jgi:hypothetical protein
MTKPNTLPPGTTVKFKLVYKSEEPPTYVTGAFGGLIPSGDLCVKFYLDTFSVPDVFEHKVADNGKLAGVVMEQKEDISNLRFVERGVVMNKANALVFYKWFQTKLLEMGVGEDELCDDATIAKE